MDNSRHPSKRVSLAGMHIDRNSAVPLHLQIAAHIRDGILRGVFPAGTQFLGSRRIGLLAHGGVDRLGSALRRGLS
ncbi:hypothetical protein QA633_16245 [Bradyrhizobium barranii]|uniref:hypothetical protein n=1 Tax=Bradyrhizobium barranii TaxID=2992140 RepID=UPI0024B050CE|nr:hypothetical protein [Bradyrhizobium barranii]WFT98454.1 hypothetical protein QA633_16245 [Bradyrhizobium barranii]